MGLPYKEEETVVYITDGSNQIKVRHDLYTEHEWYVNGKKVTEEEYIAILKGVRS